MRLPSFVRRRGSSLLLGLILLVQCASLFITVNMADLRDGYAKTMLLTNAIALSIGLALAWLMRCAPARKRSSSARPVVRAVRVPARPAILQAAAMANVRPVAMTAGSSLGCVAAKVAAAEPCPTAHSVNDVLEHLAHQAQHDSLTGLPNRSLAMDRLQQAIRRAERHRHSLAVMFLDLNGFKPLNDTYGHEFGDKVLRKTAERLKRSIREVDTVARLGGDEFLIIMEQVDQDKALETAQVLSTIVRQPVAGKLGPVSVGMSSGIAMYPQHATTARHLLRAADAAMYRSKRVNGRPVLAEPDATRDNAPSPTGRFNETTSIHLTMLDTWEGTIRSLRALSEDQVRALSEDDALRESSHQA
jgi:diguanylate cyclase (GGDEF)-like protein